MARWHVTTARRLHDRGVAVCRDAELRLLGVHESDGVYLHTYAKRAVDNANFLQVADDSWVCVAGTLIAAGGMGQEALREVYERFVERGLDYARSPAIGHYSVAIRCGNTIYAFTDEQAAMRLYYATVKPGEHILSNSLHVVSAALDEPRVDPTALVASVFHGDSLGEDTFFDGVKRLFGSQLLEIDLCTARLTVHSFPQTFDGLSLEDTVNVEVAVAAYAERVRAIFSQIAAQPSIGLNTTGGIDTRTALAALLASGAHPLLMYGVGDSMLTNTKSRDLSAARALAERSRLPLYEMDWRGRQPHEASRLTSLFSRYGFLYLTYGASDNMLAELECGIHPYPELQVGGYGSAVTNAKLWEASTREYDFSGLVDGACPEVGYLASEARSRYREYAAHSITQALANSPVNYPQDGATLEQYVQARLFLATPIQSQNPVFFSQFAHYLSPFLMKSLHDPLVTVPLEYRHNDEFQVRLIAHLNSEVLAVPVFSGLKSQSVDLATMTMRPDVVANCATSRESAVVRAAKRVWRLLPLGVRRTIRPPRRAAAVGPRAVFDPDVTKDQVRTALVCSEAVSHVSSHPMTTGIFSDVGALHLARLYGLRMKIHAVEQVTNAATHRNVR